MRLLFICISGFMYSFINFQDVNTNDDYGLKPKLYKHWLDVYKKSGGTDFHSSKQRLFFTICK